MNIYNITENILRNYDENTENFISLLHTIKCTLIYNDKGLRDCILNRKVYSCSLKLKMKKNKIKILSNIFPIMIGSKLDIAIRKLNIFEFESLQNIPNILDYWVENDKEFNEPDIAITCFIINGILKQIPFFITNDPSNVHIVHKNVVRVYRYDLEEKGKQLSMYFANLDNYRAGNLVIKFNNGKSVQLNQYEEVFVEINDFFECPYNVKVKVYFKKIFLEGFKIDNIENKIVISPGYLFYKLFRKTLFVPIQEKNYALIRKKHLIVSKSIENGDLLHIISKKTVFYKEMNLKNKMINSNVQVEVQREIGQNDEIYMEKRTTCYRDVNCQFYPYLPYLSHFAQIQISNKVKLLNALSFNDSFIGFLCIFGTTETKNVGRSMMLARDTFVSTQENLSNVYKILNLEEGSDSVYVVVNSACIEVTKPCFNKIDIMEIKHRFTYIECYQTDNFIHITYKIGLLFKKLETNLWVTARELYFWMNKLYGYKELKQLIDFKGYNFITSFSADIITYFKHNAYPKNILTLNALKNAILSNTPKYSLYFFETISAYTNFTAKHKPLLKPENKLSEYFTMYLPRLNLMYASFQGSTQEDCIVMNDKINVFDSYRLYTVKIKFKNNASKYFHPSTGLPNPAEMKSFLGTIVCPTNKLIIISQTMHLLVNNITENVVEISFNKPNFEVLNYYISETYLFVSIRTFHKCSYGDKLCSLHGQKGVVSIFSSLPRSLYMKPDLIINPYCLISRETMGQIIESVALGGKDYDCLINSDGKPIPGTSFIGPVHYFPISYWSSEHIYIAKKCIKDKILGQPVRGRSRHGGMRIGNMEHFNCFIGNGLASNYEEKIIEHSDRIINNDIAIPKSVILCKDDANFFKCNITYKTKNVIEDIN